MQHNQKTVDTGLLEFVGEERVRMFAETPQDPEYHAEGDVLIHLSMMLEVCDELCPSLGFSKAEHQFLRRAIYLHDYCKPECTKEVDGRIRSPHHSTRGEKMVRRILYERNYNPLEREKLCALVRFHIQPTHLFMREEPELELARLAIALNMPCKYLYALAICDNKGRITKTQDELLTNIELFAELAREQECFEQTYNIAQHFQQPLTAKLEEELKHYLCEPSYQLNLGWKYRDPGSFPRFKGEFKMLCGFPGVGKTTYLENLIQENSSELETKVISLDDLREEMDSPKIKAGEIYNMAKTTLKDYFRQQEKEIYLDATSLSKDIRSFWLKLAKDYGYRTHIIVLERPFEKILENNLSRERQVPEKAIHRMLHIFDFPTLREAHQISWQLL